MCQRYILKFSPLLLTPRDTTRILPSNMARFNRPLFAEAELSSAP
jgi:hypothetical protein